jgi:hypothetical protein
VDSIDLYFVVTVYPETERIHSIEAGPYVSPDVACAQARSLAKDYYRRVACLRFECEVRELTDAYAYQ